MVISAVYVLHTSQWMLESSRCILLEYHILTPLLLNNFMFGVGDALNRYWPWYWPFQADQVSAMRDWFILNTEPFHQCQYNSLFLNINSASFSVSAIRGTWYNYNEHNLSLRVPRTTGAMLLDWDLNLGIGISIWREKVGSLFIVPVWLLIGVKNLLLNCLHWLGEI